MGEHTKSKRTAHQQERERRRYLLHQLPAARAKVQALVNEARRYGMTELLLPEELID